MKNAADVIETVKDFVEYLESWSKPIIIPDSDITLQEAFQSLRALFPDAYSIDLERPAIKLNPETGKYSFGQWRVWNGKEFVTGKTLSGLILSIEAKHAVPEEIDFVDINEASKVHDK